MGLSAPAAPGTGERGGPRVRRRLRSARHPGRAPSAGARAPQSGWRLRAVSGIRPEHGVAARIATRGRSQPGCVHAGVRPTGRLRVVQPSAFGACFPLPGLGRAVEMRIRARTGVRTMRRRSRPRSSSGRCPDGRAMQRRHRSGARTTDRRGGRCADCRSRPRRTRQADGASSRMTGADRRGGQFGSAQFSSLSPGIRLNSRVLLLTSVAPIACACAAISVS